MQDYLTTRFLTGDVALSTEGAVALPDVPNSFICWNHVLDYVATIIDDYKFLVRVILLKEQSDGRQHKLSPVRGWHYTRCQRLCIHASHQQSTIDTFPRKHCCPLCLSVLFGLRTHLLYSASMALLKSRAGWSWKRFNLALRVDGRVRYTLLAEYDVSSLIPWTTHETARLKGGPNRGFLAPTARDVTGPGGFVQCTGGLDLHLAQSMEANAC
jgi:hypothetical protein